jgi:uncharacterized protein YjiS (DUF1127 family)
MFDKLKGQFAQARDARRARDALRQLDDHLLRDIGYGHLVRRRRDLPPPGGF